MAVGRERRNLNRTTTLAAYRIIKKKPIQGICVRATVKLF
jgi:hypothetical protein